MYHHPGARVSLGPRAGHISSQLPSLIAGLTRPPRPQTGAHLRRAASSASRKLSQGGQRRHRAWCGQRAAGLPAEDDTPQQPPAARAVPRSNVCRASRLNALRHAAAQGRCRIRAMVRSDCNAIWFCYAECCRQAAAIGRGERRGRICCCVAPLLLGLPACYGRPAGAAAGLSAHACCDGRAMCPCTGCVHAWMGHACMGRRAATHALVGRACRVCIQLKHAV